MSALPLLTISREGETLKSQTLDKEISIGRGEGNLVRLDDRAVSRKHAIIRKTQEGVHIERQSDFAPIRVNGVECTRALMKEGDVVDIGPYRMRLDTPKPKETPRDPDATVAISDANLQVAETLPTEGLGLGTSGAPVSIGDFTTEISKPEANGTFEISAEPIVADEKGAEEGSRDPGTNIFPTDGELGSEPIALDIDFGASGPEAAPEEVLATPIDENAPTQMLSGEVKARLDIPDGMANVNSLRLNKDEIFIGRGKECDIVLNDKKSSRKNTVIRRDGNHFRVRDLDSSNGTFVNNAPVKDVELSADDLIRIGDVEIRFIADSEEYEKRRATFLPVESVAPEPEPLGSLSSPIQATPVDMGAEVFGAPSAPVVPPRKGIFGLIDKYVKNFGSLKPMQKILVLLVGVLFLSWYFEEELGLTEPEKPVQKTAPVRTTTDGKPAAPTDFDSLPAAKRAEIEEAIRKATDFLRLQDFDKAIYEVQQRIYPILASYPQAKEIERYALEGKRRKEAIEEEAKKKEEELNRKLRIGELETATREFMSKKKYEKAQESFSEILSIDPENPNVAEWKKEIDTWLEEQDRIAKEKQVQEEINKRAWDTYNEALELHKAGKYREAIELYQKVPELGANDSRLLKKAATMAKASRDSIRELRDPHLKSAQEFEKNADLASAFKEYQRATEIDPPHPEGWAGMDRIRDILTERSKILYTEAVIAESYSDFKTAHAKFTEILKMAPEGSLYYQRAQRKLQSYLNFHPEETQ